MNQALEITEIARLCRPRGKPGDFPSNRSIYTALLEYHARLRVAGLHAGDAELDAWVKATECPVDWDILTEVFDEARNSDKNLFHDLLNLQHSPQAHHLFPRSPGLRQAFEAARHLSENGTKPFYFARSMAAKMAGYHDADGTPSNDGGKMVIKRLISKGVINKLPPPAPADGNAKPHRNPTNQYTLNDDVIPF